MHRVILALPLVVSIIGLGAFGRAAHESIGGKPYAPRVLAHGRSLDHSALASQSPTARMIRAAMATHGGLSV